jgi:nodulation protein E
MSTLPRRVVITGQGVVSSLGNNASEHLEGLRSGRCGIAPIELIDSEGLLIKIAAEAKGFIGTDHFTRDEITLRDRVTQMAIIAAREAFSQSGLKLDAEAAARTATVVGTCMGGQHTQDDNYRLIYREGKKRVHPFLVPRLMANAPVSWVSMEFGLTGPAYSVSTACSSSNHAIGQAFHLIRSGAVDAAIAGGAESGLTFGVLKAWEGMRVCSQTGCRPFSANRNGLVQGEGAAMFVLECFESARARGAPILGEIIGYGAGADASDIVHPSQPGAVRTMRAAIRDSGIDLAEIGHVNAHGTATALNDKTECASIREVLGAHADSITITSTKSMHGHCIGAAGALEMVATLMAVNGIAPPTINYDEPDPECDLDVVANVARPVDCAVAMSNSFAFGGLNAVLLARRFEA